MNEAVVSKASPVQTLAVSAMPLRELLNFLVYRQNTELLNERARYQPALSISKIPSSIREIGEMLGADKCEKGRKLYFDCTDAENHRALLLHNFNAQFWVHYFRCGLGLVNVSCFSQLASAEGSVLPLMTRNVTGSFEYQWFVHDLGSECFGKGKRVRSIESLARYFVKKVNPRLVIPYTFYFQKIPSDEPYKFVRGSLENLKFVLVCAFVVCERLRQRRDLGARDYFSPTVTVTCGNLKSSPKLEHSSEVFLNQVGVLAIRENVPYAVLNNAQYLRIEGNRPAYVRANKYYLYLNIGNEVKEMSLRAKIAACSYLVDWLRKQGEEGDWIVKYWKLESSDF